MKNKLSPEANISAPPRTRGSTALSHLRLIPRRGLSRVEGAIQEPDKSWRLRRHLLSSEWAQAQQGRPMTRTQARAHWLTRRQRAQLLQPSPAFGLSGLVDTILSSVRGNALRSFATRASCDSSGVVRFDQSDQAAKAVAQLGALAGMAGVGAAKPPDEMYLSLLRTRRLQDALIQRFGLQKRYGKSTLLDTRNL